MRRGLGLALLLALGCDGEAVDGGTRTVLPDGATVVLEQPANDAAVSPGTDASVVAPTGDCGGALGNDLLPLVNADRAAAGLSALRCDGDLARVALGHSQDMCTRGYFDHYSPEGKTHFDRLAEAGVNAPRSGENILGGDTAAAPAHAAWMASPTHRANILNPPWTRMGVGTFECPGMGIYWTVLFASD